jgi:hypothetical protein
MFSFLQKNHSAKRFLPALLGLLFLTSLLLASCAPVTNDASNTFTVPATLKGTWRSTFDEEYIISDTVFTSAYMGAVGYEGDIVNVRSLNSGNESGYITIKYTTAYNPEWVGNYYVVYWNNLTANSVDLCGAALGDGKASQSEAEDFYIIANDQFTFSSSCSK